MQFSQIDSLENKGDFTDAILGTFACGSCGPSESGVSSLLTLSKAVENAVLEVMGKAVREVMGPAVKGNKRVFRESVKKECSNVKEESKWLKVRMVKGSGEEQPSEGCSCKAFEESISIANNNLKLFQVIHDKIKYLIPSSDNEDSFSSDNEESDEEDSDNEIMMRSTAFHHKYRIRSKNGLYHDKSNGLYRFPRTEQEELSTPKKIQVGYTYEEALENPRTKEQGNGEELISPNPGEELDEVKKKKVTFNSVIYYRQYHSDLPPSDDVYPPPPSDKDLAQMMTGAKSSADGASGNGPPPAVVAPVVGGGGPAAPPTAVVAGPPPPPPPAVSPPEFEAKRTPKETPKTSRDDPPRGDFLSQIRGGVKLREVEQDKKVTPDLLSQIRGGVKLKDKENWKPLSPVKNENIEPDFKKIMMDSLSSLMNPSGDEDDNDENGDEENEWKE